MREITIATKDKSKRPHVTVGVIIIKDGKFLLGKRLNAIGAGTWGMPGGKLEFGEDIADCAKREVYEETGLKIKNIRSGSYTNDYFQEEGIHFVSIVLVADYDSGILEVMEPEKCSEWQWFEWDKMPEPLFLPMKNLVKQEFNPFEK
ncbi:MAG: nucleotide triphosphate diphosphatase NUDT15 [Candidatus Woesearchaeota archaeon]